jgi:hypothetical protein
MSITISLGRAQVPVRRFVLGAVLGSLGAASVLTSSAVGAATVPTAVSFGGSAYGSTASLGSLVRSGPTAALPMCTRSIGYTRTNRTAALALPRLGTVGAVTSRVGSSHRGDTRTSSVSTHTARTSLLAGIIRADAISTSAQVSGHGSAYTNTGRTTFVHLHIAGRAIAATAPVNKKLAIPALGTVTLNAQYSAARAGVHYLIVNALVLRVNPTNTAGLPAGTVVIGHSAASLHAPVHRRAYGSAFASTVQVAGHISSGRTAAVYLPCGGSSGATVRNPTAAVHVAGLIATGAATSTAHSSDYSSTTSAATQSRITHINLLNGRIKVNALTTRAQATRSTKHLSLSSAGTTLTGLVVNGAAQPALRPHTSRTVAGLGVLSLGHTVTSRTGLQVYGLRLTLTHSVGATRAGTTITIGGASAGVTLS